LLNETTHYEKLRKIFNEWYEQNSSSLKPVFLAHSEDIFNAICEVFKNPDLRLMWLKSLDNVGKEEELNIFFKSVFDLTDFGDVFSVELPNAFDSELLKKGIYKLFQEFLEIKEKFGEINSTNMNKYFDFVDSISRFPNPTKDLSEGEIEFRNQLKKFVDFIKNIKSDLRYLDQNFETYQEWNNLLKNVFNFFEKKYFDFQGLAFSDLEYYVCNGLDDVKVVNDISNQYKYFIVDEFQDTSPIQFDILKKVTLNDVNKLFCVGDKKQAIYGFRGGELQVFESCSKMMGAARNLNLVSNYRSDKAIIDFNNCFFKDVLPSGEGFEGHDKHVIQMEAQLAPKETSAGQVTKFTVDVQDLNIDPDYVEALALIEIIKENLNDTTIKSIAVLYKKLKPSTMLVELLQKNNIAFVAQTKIKQSEDPVISLYIYSVKYLLTSDIDKRSSLAYLMNKLIMVIGGQFNQNILDIFQRNYNLYGCYVAFLKFLNDLKMSNSYFENNLTLLKNLTDFSEGDLRILLESLERLDGSYSLDLVSGKDKKVHLLSTHTSKGLEYDVVLVAGIHKNGRSEGLKSKVGKLPRSFKWKSSFDQKKFSNSPNYFVENIILKEKDFSESKRLLYVACTRAIRHLYFVEVSSQGKLLSKYPNSWLMAFKNFAQYVDIKELKIVNIFNKESGVSLILKDKMGIETYSSPYKMAISSELSVTRLVSLVECPFKFYLKNICKINSDNFAKLVFDEDEVVEFKSSATRGTDLHFQISNTLNGKLVKSIADESQWAIDQFRLFKIDEFYSEREIKFLLFGNMISAIPDLYFKKEKTIEIWDFKSGLRDVDKEVGYWFQLYAYAYGISKVDGINQDYSFNLKILYLDQKNIVSKSLNLVEIEQSLFQEWRKLEDLTQVNLLHCKKCEFNQMCKSASTVATI
jgi:superfamily I DNA/RNA helicase